jgi:MoxR-like ATPase
MTEHENAEATSSGDGARRPVWLTYRGDGIPPAPGITVALPDPPPWRSFQGIPVQSVQLLDDEDFDRKLGRPNPRWVRTASQHERDMVNAAIALRRPLLVTGPPGAGKSSLAYRIARELGLGTVLSWPVTSHSTLRSGLYEYDAIGRMQAAATSRSNADSDEADSGAGIGDFIRLGPIGTALLAYERPRVLLIDELDKSDIDLPNDLLHVLENGRFEIPELLRIRHRHPDVKVYTDDPSLMATVSSGLLQCRAFPIVVITSNGEREFPSAFVRRCVRLEIPPPDAAELASMIRAQLPSLAKEPRGLIEDFLARTDGGEVARSQLLDAVYLINLDAHADDPEKQQALIDNIMRILSVE